jgi:hypothetical protein
MNPDTSSTRPDPTARPRRSDRTHLLAPLDSPQGRDGVAFCGPVVGSSLTDVPARYVQTVAFSEMEGDKTGARMSRRPARDASPAWPALQALQGSQRASTAGATGIASIEVFLISHHWMESPSNRLGLDNPSNQVVSIAQSLNFLHHRYAIPTILGFSARGSVKISHQRFGLSYEAGACTP